MANFVSSVLHNEEWRHSALKDKQMMRVMKDTLLNLIQKYADKMNFAQKRKNASLNKIAEARSWVPSKSRANWQYMVSLLQEAEAGNDGNAPIGPNCVFYKNEFTRMAQDNRGEASNAFQATWDSLLNDCEQAVNTQLRGESQRFVDSQRNAMEQLVGNNLSQASAYVEQHPTSHEQFFQTWGLMGGRWNSVEFERLQRVANLQRKYPQLMRMAELMGRHTSPEGKSRIRVTSGMAESMEHASQSDIVGISMGRDLGLLLPSELVLFADEKMENLFFEKYVTQRLQTFQNESRSLNAARPLRTETASPKGPMVVCVDRSASMSGEAERVALSLMMKLTEMCDKQHRACYLIAFAVQAQPIDVLRDRAMLLRFFNSRSAGCTDACHMMDETFKLIQGNTTFNGADVLWISDFRIPIPSSNYLKRMEETKQDGCKWNGLQLGTAENKWLAHFNQMVCIPSIKTAIW